MMIREALLRLLSHWNKKPIHKIRDKIDRFEFYKLIDEGFCASWDEKTGKRIKWITYCYHQGLLTSKQMFDYFDMLEKIQLRKWNDKKGDYKEYEPLEVSYKYDGVTDYGLSLIMARFVGKEWTPVTHMGAGDGVGDTVDYQDTLVTERLRYQFNKDGFMDAIGKTARFHMTFDINAPSFTFKEIGLFNNENPNVGPLIARTTFDPGTVHTAGSNYVTASYLISCLSS